MSIQIKSKTLTEEKMVCSRCKNNVDPSTIHNAGRYDLSGKVSFAGNQIDGNRLRCKCGKLVAVFDYEFLANGNKQSKWHEVL
jgi:hypothetical protein